MDRSGVLLLWMALCVAIPLLFVVAQASDPNRTSSGDWTRPGDPPAVAAARRELAPVSASGVKAGVLTSVDGRVFTPPHAIAEDYQGRLISLSEVAIAYDWTRLERDWQEPSEASMRSWLQHYFDGISDFVRDNGKEALSRYGWDRKWPPAEGFPTAYDVDRLIEEKFEYFELAMKYRAFETMALELADVTQTDYRPLAQSYRMYANEAWLKVFEGDAYPPDVFALCVRVGL